MMNCGLFLRGLHSTFFKTSGLYITLENVLLEVMPALSQARIRIIFLILTFLNIFEMESCKKRPSAKFASLCSSNTFS